MGGTCSSGRCWGTPGDHGRAEGGLKGDGQPGRRPSERGFDEEERARVSGVSGGRGRRAHWPKTDLEPARPTARALARTARGEPPTFPHTHGNFGIFANLNININKAELRAETSNSSVPLTCTRLATTHVAAPRTIRSNKTVNRSSALPAQLAFGPSLCAYSSIHLHTKRSSSDLRLITTPT